MFLLLSLVRYLCWWTICPRGYHHPPVVSISTLTWFIIYLSLYYYRWVDTSTGGLLSLNGIPPPASNQCYDTDMVY